MNSKLVFAFALAGVMAIVGCVSVDGTRAKLNSKDASEVKKAEDAIYQIATRGKDSTGLIKFETQEQIEYVKLTSNHDLLLKIIDNSHNGDVIEAAVERIDFTKEGVAREFVLMHFDKIDRIKRQQWNYDSYRYEDLSDVVQNNLKKKVIANLTQDELLELISDKRKNDVSLGNGLRDRRQISGAEISYHDRDMLVNRLIEITDSPVILLKIKHDEIHADTQCQNNAERRLLTMLDKVTDAQMAEQLLSELPLTIKQRLSLMKKLPEDKMVEQALSRINGHNVNRWNEGNLAALQVGIEVIPSIKDTESVVKIASAVLAKIAEYRKACEGSWMMVWDASDEGKVKKLLGRLPNLSDDAVIALVCLDGDGWKYFMPSVTEDVAYKVLILGKAKSAELEEALIKKLPHERVDMQVYNGVKTDAGKKAVLAAMPAEMKKTAQAAAENAFASVLEKAKVAANETFELQGFYLGMEWEDMKQVLSHHFPDYTITEGRDGDEKDADYVVYVPRQRTPFCYATAKDKKVYQINFGKAMLKKWYNYDVQTYMEWANAYGRETKIDMKFKVIEKDATVYEPMDMSRSYRVWFHQESFQYKHNTKGYRLTYFGEENEFTVEGGIGGDLIKEMASPRFRYVRGDPGLLRATIENN